MNLIGSNRKGQSSSPSVNVCRIHQFSGSVHIYHTTGLCPACNHRIIFHDVHFFFSILVPVCIVFVYTTEMSLRGADMTHKVPQKHEGNMDYNKTRTIQVAMQPSLPTLLNICK